MKTIFDKATRDGLIVRISSLTENSTAQWGKMSAFQMLRHCTKWEEMALGKTMYKQSFLGRLFGKMALRSLIKDENPLKRNVPTVPEFRMKDETGNLEEEKQKWISLMEQYDTFSNDNFIHPFFGRMTKQELGWLAYKHSDHHLRQFNA